MPLLRRWTLDLISKIFLLLSAAGLGAVSCTGALLAATLGGVA